jgi:hypothetical protein
MALILADRVRETSTTTGSGALTLAGAVTGYQTFSAAIGNANTCYYAISNPGIAEWEVGIGTYATAGNTLTRTTVLKSSNANAAVVFSAGTKDVFVTYPATKSVYLDASGNASSLGTPAAFTATNVTGLPISTGVSGLGTGVATALAVNVGTAGAPVVNGGVLGTPSSGTLTNCTFPTLNQNTTGTAANVTGIVAIANGGTNSTATATAGGIGYGTGTAHAYTAAGTSGQVLTSAGAGVPTWTTPTTGTVTSVTGTAPVVSSGGTTPAISMAAATTSVNGYLTSTDWNTFNGKQAALVSGTNIKTVNSTTLLGSGDVSVGVTSVTGTAPVVSSGGATPAISMAAASTSVSGYLTSTDWNTFNGKQAAGSYVTVGGALGTPSSGTLTNCTFPTLNQNTTGSSGSCTGNAATATSATTATTAGTCSGNSATASTLVGDQTNWASYRSSAVANMLGWKNYANNHVIFDASASTSPSGSAVNNTNSTYAWSGTYPTLMGWNGANTYGVRVDSARISDSTSGSSASCTGNAATATSATTATNQSGGTVSATTGTFSGAVSANAGIGGTLRRGSYGSLSINGSNAGYSGLDLYDQSATWMTNIAGGVSFGVYKSNTTWAFYFDQNGTLQTGTIPGGNVSGAVASATTATTASNSNTVGGYTPSASAGTANRVVLADASGYIFNNYFNSTDNVQSASMTYVMGKFGDNYLRSGTAACVATFLSGQTMNISGSSTSCTGNAAGLSATLAVASGGTGVTSSTGSGSNVLSTSPTLVTPILGTPASGNLSNCTGVANTAKAWLCYNGISQTILGSFNVSSVTYNGAGDYTVNFTTAMANANYSAVLGTTAYNSPSDNRGGISLYGNGASAGPTTKTTTALRVQTGYIHTTGGTQFDVYSSSVAIFGS